MSAAVGVVVMAYGTPAGPAQLEAYYTHIRRGRPPAPEQLSELAARYEAIGGVSPLTARTAAQQHALQAALDRRAPDRYRVVLGMKHASPFIEDAVTELADGGAERIVGLVLAPHYSSASVGEYLARAERSAAEGSLPFTGIRSWATLPAYVDFLAGGVRAALGHDPAAPVVFTAHSLPERVAAAGDPYPEELRSTAVAVAAAAGLASDRWSTGWQSAGRTPEPWLGPDIGDTIERLAAGGARSVVVCPCGFVADHLEVLYDLDIEAAGRASARGMALLRTPVVNADPAVMDALAAVVDAHARP